MNKVIAGTGSYLPEAVVTNDDIERRALDYRRERAGVSLHEWVMQRTGVACRHRVASGEGTSDMAAAAARRALDDAGLQPEDLDLIVLSTSTTDYPFPNSSGLLQGLLGATCKFYQIEAAGCGFVDAMILGSALMDLLGAETALVCASDAPSVYCDPQLFMAQTVYGDGAGAVILKNSPNQPYGLKAYYSGGDGRLGDWVSIPGIGPKNRLSQEVIEKREHYLRVQFEDVYPFAVAKMVESAHEVVRRAGKTLDEVAWFVPQQAGQNIVGQVARELGQSLDKFAVCFDHTGDTAGAAIPIALDEANRAGRFRDGDVIVMTAFGAGMAWGALAVVWHDYRAQRNNEKS